MKLTKNIRQYIKIALSAGLLAFPSCSYLDVIPPAQPDFDDTMKGVPSSSPNHTERS